MKSTKANFPRSPDEPSVVNEEMEPNEETEISSLKSPTLAPLVGKAKDLTKDNNKSDSTVARSHTYNDNENGYTPWYNNYSINDSDNYSQVWVDHSLQPIMEDVDNDPEQDLPWNERLWRKRFNIPEEIDDEEIDDEEEDLFPKPITLIGRRNGKVAFSYYPLIGRYYCEGKIVEIYEREYDLRKPFDQLPCCQITDQGVLQIFYEKGWFSQPDDLPEFRCFDDDGESNMFPTYVEGPYTRIVDEFHYGYTNLANTRTEHQFRLRINPEQWMEHQTPYNEMDSLDKVLVQEIDFEFECPNLDKLEQRYDQLMEDFSKLTLSEKRRVICTEKYDLGYYMHQRVTGMANAKTPLVREVIRHYYNGKFLRNHLTGEMEFAKPLNNNELAAVARELETEPVKPVVKNVHFILGIQNQRFHPISRKFQKVFPKPLPWQLSDQKWIPEDPFGQKKKNYVKFKPLKPNMSVYHSTDSQELPQVEIFDPEDPDYKFKTLRKPTTNPDHPLTNLINDWLENRQSVGEEPETQQSQETE